MTTRKRAPAKPSLLKRLLAPLNEPMQVLVNLFIVGGTVLAVTTAVGKPAAERFINASVDSRLEAIVVSIDNLAETQKQTAAATNASLATLAAAQKQSSADLALTQTQLKIVQGALEEQQRTAARVIELIDKSPALKGR
jgi:hypothetical protein